MNIYTINKKLFIILFIISGCNDNREVILYEEFRGVISDIYIDRNSHNVYKFNIREDKEDRFVVADFYPGSKEYASIGDSILKNKGDSFIIIKKENGNCKNFETRIK